MRLLIVIFVLVALAAAQTAPKPNPSPKVPKYNAAAEAVYKGTVDDLKDRECPVSGGMGSHIMLKMENGEIIEVHLATTKFIKLVDMNLKKGDTIEVTGWKTEFEGVQTIFARAIKHGDETYMFRDKDGKPAWIY
jgi:TusA-related sulfurtransferase